jgi:anti-sigma factor RsiW
MTSPGRIADTTFNAYVDGRLAGRAERDVALALEKDPAGAARAAAWRRQGEALRAAFGPIADEPLPLSIILKVRASSPEGRWSGSVGIASMAFTAGLAVGFVLAWIVLAIA